MAWHCIAWHDMAWRHVALRDLAWRGVAWHGMVLSGMTWHDVGLRGVVHWCGVVSLMGCGVVCYGMVFITLKFCKEIEAN